MSALTDNIRLFIRHGILAKDDGEKLIRYLQTGDEALVAAIPKSSLDAVNLLDETTASPSAWNEENGRLVRLLVRRKVNDCLAHWLQVVTTGPNGDWANLPLCQSHLRAAGLSDAAFADVLAQRSTLVSNNKPTPAGLLVLQAPDDQLLRCCRSKARFSWQDESVPELLALAQPERLLRFLHGGFTPDTLLCETLLKANFDLFQDTVRAYAENLRDFSEKVRLLRPLAKGDPARHGKWAEAQIEKRLEGKADLENYDWLNICATLWYAASEAARAFTHSWLRGALDKGRYDFYGMQRSLLDFLAERFPSEVPAAASACLENPAGEVALAGLKALMKPAVPPGDPAFLAEARRLLAHADAEAVAKAAPLLAGWDLAGVTADLWALMRHKSRPVRLAAARALLPLGRAALEGPCRELLAHKKADLRQTAVILLAMAGGGESTALLKRHLEAEENDDVRDEILRALDRLGGGAAFTLAELAARVVKTVERFKKPPTSWPKAAGLRLPRRSGPALDADETLYLFIRQSRAKDMRADLEAKALYAQLDRPGCGDAARTVLSRFLDSDQDAGDRWMMTFAALLGDDRLVPPLHRAILDWADHSRGKLAEYGAQALALLGTDAALMTVDALSVRFRSKNKNVGAAAAEAFAAAAEARGVGVEELGDLVVPWLGFEHGRPLRVELGKGAVEARIGPDFKPVYTDPATGKRTGKLPASAPAEAQARAKELAAALKDAAKSQLLRLETLLVRQFAWPVERWRELYPHHPLLRPFAQRLVWAAVTDGRAPRFFHMLEDGSLTDAEDQPVDLPGAGTVHIAHPLEMGESTRQAWIAHLADHAIEPPFPQLARPVARVEEKDRARRRGDALVGTELNAMTFRGRAEKLGWVRGSVADAGCVTSYRKHFAGAGIDAFLLLEGMYMGIDREASITLDQTFFVKAGAVSTGSYVYDEPNSDDDPRLLAFGDVPEIPYSEVMGDLARIAGNRDAAEAES